MINSLYRRQGFDSTHPTYTTRRSSHTSRFITQLLFDIQGQNKVLEFAKCSFLIAAVSSSKHPSLSRTFEQGQEMCSDAKVLMDFASVPLDVLSWYRKFNKTRKIIITSLNQHSDFKIYLEAGVRSIGLVEKSLSVVNRSTLKPLKLAKKYVDLGSAGTMISQTSELCGMTKSASKICYLFSMLILGCKRPEKKILELTLEGWDFAHEILRYNHMPVHPIPHIFLCVSKCLFSFANLWISTN